MLVGALIARFAHGLLILAAPESTDPHDDWDPDEPVHAGTDSLYIGVLPAASGLVRVECFDGGDLPSGRTPLFAGELHLESRKFRLYDPNQTVLLTVLTDSPRVRITVFGDSPEDPADVKIFVTSVG